MAAFGRSPMRWVPRGPRVDPHTPAVRPGHDSLSPFFFFFFLRQPPKPLIQFSAWLLLGPLGGPACTAATRDQFLQIVGRVHIQHHLVRTFSRPRNKNRRTAKMPLMIATASRPMCIRRWYVLLPDSLLASFCRCGCAPLSWSASATGCRGRRRAGLPDRGEAIQLGRTCTCCVASGFDSQAG